MTASSMRTPGAMPHSFAIECSPDNLAAQLGLGPIKIRLRNHADEAPDTGKLWSSKSLEQRYQRGAERYAQWLAAT